MNADKSEHVRPIVQYPNEIAFPAGNETDFFQAADAVKKEYCASVKWKELHCRNVVPTKDPSIFEVSLGQTVEFDWSWEGATAFRPRKTLDKLHFRDDQDKDESNVWAGEVVEVNEAEGIIFVWIDDSEKKPVKGAFFVRPYEFLATLHAIYNDSTSSTLKRTLTERLLASRPIFRKKP